MSGYATSSKFRVEPMPGSFNGSLRKTICEEVSKNTDDTELPRQGLFAAPV
jgi:hypothetical protein